MNPAIVIPAYNRPKSLKRLLDSLSKADFGLQPVELIISLDQSDNHLVLARAEAFDWPFGKKTVVLAEEHLGLKRHIFACAGYTKTHGAIVLLEDDLVVSPHFYAYACEALKYYGSDEKIAGISLYDYAIAESCALPFQPIMDGSDVYFMQFPSSWGQLWTAEQWGAFESWYDSQGEVFSDDIAPAYVHQWSNKSWKKWFLNYLIQTEKYFVFPRGSYTTNFADAGTHSNGMDLFQVPLQMGKKSPAFRMLKDSGARYDAWFELEASVLQSTRPELKVFDFEVDTYGQKPLEKEGLYLTSRSASEGILSYSSELKPVIANALMGIEGSALTLASTAHILQDSMEASLFVSLSLLDNVAKTTAPWINLNIVVPITHWDEDTLTSTMNCNPSGVQIEWILCGKREFREVLYQYSANSNQSIRVHLSDHTSADELVQEAWQFCSKQLLTWVLPGRTFREWEVSRLPRLFNENTDVCWASGIDSKHASRQKKGFNSAPFRLNTFTVRKAILHGSLPTSEGMFWRRDACIEHLKRSNGTAEIFKNLLEDGIRYQLIVLSFFTESMRRIEVNKGVVIPNTSASQRIFGSLSHPFFKANIAYLRIFFGELFPAWVFYFDPEYDNFHRERY